MSKDSDLYGEDIRLWSEAQSALLRSLSAGEAVADQVDWAHVVEEIEHSHGQHPEQQDEVARLTARLTAAEALVNELRSRLDDLSSKLGDAKVELATAQDEAGTAKARARAATEAERAARQARWRAAVGGALGPSQSGVARGGLGRAVRSTEACSRWLLPTIPASARLAIAS